jgi:hypothetical protein
MKTTFRIFIFLLLAVPYVVKAQISAYKVSYAYINFKTAPQQRWFSLRSYMSGNSRKYLAVNPATLETRIWDEKEVNKREEIDLKTFLAQNYTYLYAQLYRKAASNDSSLQDAGFKHWFQTKRCSNWLCNTGLFRWEATLGWLKISNLKSEASF